MPIKIFFGDKARGLKRSHSLRGITKEHLDFEGKIERLSRDSKIELITGSSLGHMPKHYTVHLKQSLTRKEILSLTKKYGFKEPEDVSGDEDMRCTEHPLRTILTFPYPKQKLIFRHPYNP